MIFNTLAFLLGIGSLFFLKHLPSFSLCLILTVIFVAIGYRGTSSNSHWRQVVFCFCIGLCWTDFRLNFFFHHTPPNKIFKHSMTMHAQIISLPKQTMTGERFTVFTHSIENEPIRIKVLLNCYRFCSHLRIGDTWQWQVRLQKPHGTHNYGEFNYETWLFSQGIQAKGYIIFSRKNHVIQNQNKNFWMDRIREKIQNQIVGSVKDSNEAAILTALAVGSRTMMNENLWTILQNTGTNHLIAIAGLHLGFVTFFIYFLTSLLWRIVFPWLRFRPVSVFAYITALLSIIFYSFLAGLSIPTERSLLMFFILIVSVFLYRPINLLYKLCVALWIILLLDPITIVSQSFWLSFLAMLSIAYVFESKRVKPGKLAQWVRIQMGIFLGIFPLTFWFFYKISWVSLLANAVAIPWVGFCILPLVLFSSMILFVNGVVAAKIFVLDAMLLHPLLVGLQWLSALPFATTSYAYPNAWLFLVSFAAVLILLMPKGLPGRWLAVIYLLSVFCYKIEVPVRGGLKLILLDVGQGLSAIIQTQNHVIGYEGRQRFHGLVKHHVVDGPQLLDNAVVFHYLLYLRKKKFDRIISTNFAQNGELSWAWDEVQFLLLDHGRILRITTAKQSILLMDGVKKGTQELLLKSKGKKLAADILIASNVAASFSSRFIQGIHPSYALFSISYYTFCHAFVQNILKRYFLISSRIFTTAKDGAIIVRISSRAGVTLASVSRGYRFWQNPY